ncbi:MAG: hypothetical protein JW943_12840 [Deltaproteobacteria bacterium]|nr:hypothetical protein [Deltaproteobacteria bacterium]
MRTQRRIALLIIFALAILQGCHGGDATSQPNPLATADQLNAERSAINIAATPEVQQAKQLFAQQWLAAAGPVSAETLSYFEGAVDEMVFFMALTISTNDPNYPNIVSLLAAPHTWFGTSVPGSRMVFDNPDSTYRRIPIDPNASYIISGRQNPFPPIDANYSLFDLFNNTISNLSDKELVTAPDGSFTITVDSSPANGRPNHIQSTPQAASLFVRNTVSDWATQSFDTLSVQRVGGPPLPAPRSFNELVGQTAAFLPFLMGTVNAFINRIAEVPVNTLPPISMGGTGGLLSTQAQTYSSFQIADDEALVVTVDLGGAAYFICPVYTRWFTTTDYVNHTQSLNNAQAAANPDGTYTFVVSMKDPGIYNWVDTVGLHEGILNLRWQGLPDQPPASGGVAATIRLIKLADMATTLPSGTRYVTPSERQEQLAARAAAYARRYRDY